METIFDLPAHPLMVHFPVVAIPTLAVLALLMVVLPRFRQKYALPVIALGVVTVVATFVAAKSGQELTESLGLKDEFIDPHRELGELLRFFVLGLAVTIALLVGVNKRSASTGRDPLALTASVLVIAFALLSLVWTVRTGHEGAKAVWGTGESSSETDDAAPAETTTTTAPESTTTSSPTGETAESTDSPATTEAATTTAPSAEVSVGQQVFESNCARCHRADGSGGRGPSLQGLAVEQPDQATAIEQATNGGDQMPAFGARLEAEEIQAAIDYIYATF